MKWLWRFSSHEQSLRKNTIKARYGMEMRWITKVATQPYDTGVWRTIRNLWPKFINKCKIKIGDGRKSLFSEEVWVGQEALKVSFPNLFNLSVHKMVTIKEMRDDRGWNLRFKRPLNDCEVSRIVKFLNILEQCKGLNDNEDKLFWVPDKQGRLSVKSAYRNSQMSHIQLSYW